MSSRLDGYIDSHREELQSLVSKLVSFPTVSPPGRNTGEAQRFVAELLQELGAEVDSFELYPGDPDVVGRFRGSDPDHHRSLLFNGHIDVAEVGLESQWRHPPFQATLEGGRLFGRGTADMKGGLAAAIVATKAVIETGIRLPGDLLFEVVVGEESGEAGTIACNDRGTRPTSRWCRSRPASLPAGRAG